MARLILKERGHETLNFPVTQGTMGIGRAPENTIVLRNRYASGHHCEVLHDGTNCIMVDLESTNGVFVNGSRIERKTLEDGDKILVGAALLIYLADEDALQYESLIEQLQDGEAEERELAASLLGQFGTPEAVEHLVKSLTKDAEPRVKAAAAEALGLLGTSSLVDVLLGYFDTDEPIIRNSVVRAILRLADDDTVEGIAVYLKHMDKRVRILAAYALGQLKSKRATDYLLQALNDDTFAVREAVAKALGDLGDTKASESLIKAASEPQRFPLMWVIDSLGKIGGSAAIPLIMKTLKGYEAEVREVSAEVLGKLRAIEAIPSLIEALDDANSKVRKSASIALEILRKHIEMREKLARSTDPAKRTMEISTLGGPEDEKSSATPLYGEDRSEWGKWWSTLTGEQ